jgi:cell division protein FtsQ
VADTGNQLWLMRATSSKLLLAAFLLLVGAICMVGRNVLEAKIRQAFPIRHVRTAGVFQYLGKDEIKSVLLPQVTTDFFSVDVQAIQAAVATLPWVKTVSVERNWPDTIDIKVHEKKAYARWGKHSLITERGEIFTPRDLTPFLVLPMVEGPIEQQKKVLEVMKGIKTALADQSMELAEFTISPRWTWHIKLKNGTQIVMGRNDPLKKLQRFLKTVPILGLDRVDEMDVIDLRYLNGYAVSWRPEVTDLKWQQTMATENEKKINE